MRFHPDCRAITTRHIGGGTRCGRNVGGAGSWTQSSSTNSNGRRSKVASNAEAVIDLDKKRMLAMATKDIATLDALLADDLVYTHSSARLDTKQSLIANMKSGATVYSAVDPSQVRAQDVGDAVILTGVARIKVF